MKVILLQDLRGLGKKNDVKEVSEGYARNFLIPRGLVKHADQAALSELKSKAEDNKKRIEANRTKLRDLVSFSQKSPFVFKLKVGERNEVFGSVTAKDIKEEIVKTYRSLQPDDFEIKNERPIKALGSYEIIVDLGEGVSGKVKIAVEKA